MHGLPETATATSTLTIKYRIAVFGYLHILVKEMPRRIRSQKINIHLSFLRVCTWNLEGIGSAKIEIGSQFCGFPSLKPDDLRETVANNLLTRQKNTFRLPSSDSILTPDSAFGDTSTLLISAIQRRYISVTIPSFRNDSHRTISDCYIHLSSYLAKSLV
jgi:hypothetical protein